MLGSIVYVFNTTINTIRKATIIKQNSTLSHIHSKFSFWVLRYNTKIKIKKKKKKQQNLKFQHFPLFRFQQNKHHNSTIFILNIFFYISFQYLGLSEKPNRESKLTKKKKTIVTSKPVVTLRINRVGLGPTGEPVSRRIRPDQWTLITTPFHSIFISSFVLSHTEHPNPTTRIPQLRPYQNRRGFPAIPTIES